MKLKKHYLIWILVGWILLTLFNYYFMPFFFLAFEILAIILALLIISIDQIIKLIKERKNISKFRIQKLGFLVVLLFLSLNFQTINKAIEKVDWKIFYNKRTEIVEQIKNKKINSDTQKQFWKYELPYRFPVISNGGNDIMINRNDSLETTTVEFFVFRNFFDSPSTKFIYTNDSILIEKVNMKIINQPSKNWKIQDNWFRIYGEVY